MSLERHWHFRCPDCGFGSVELRCLAADHEIHCEICLDEQARVVLLLRWLSDETPPDGATAGKLPTSPSR